MHALPRRRRSRGSAPVHIMLTCGRHERGNVRLGGQERIQAHDAAALSTVSERLHELVGVASRHAAKEVVPGLKGIWPK